MVEKAKTVKKSNQKLLPSKTTTKNANATELESSSSDIQSKKISEQSKKEVKGSVQVKKPPNEPPDEKMNVIVVLDPASLKSKQQIPAPRADLDKNNNSSGSPDKSEEKRPEIPEVLKKQGTASYCSNADNMCPCNTMEDVEQMSKTINYCNRKSWISVERLNELRKKAQESIRNHKTFTIRGCFFSVRNALVARGWVEKLDAHRKHSPQVILNVSYEDITQTLPKRRPGETRRQYLIKCERNIMSRFLDHIPIDFLWTARKEKCDWIDQAKNPLMIINKFHRVPFTTKEGLCGQLRDFHWFYEEGMAELYFPRCYNVWSPEELNDFIENFRTTGCISFLKWIVKTFRDEGYENVFSPHGKIPCTAIDFAIKRCSDFLDCCIHNDIDNDEPFKIWEHDWDAFLTQHFILTHENARIQIDPNKIVDPIIRSIDKMLLNIREHWPQYGLDGHLNIWIVKPANKCRGRGIHLMNNIKKIISMVNPSIATKSRYVVQKYVERPLIIHNTKFDIRQWFLITSVQPLVIWMYKESYLRFSSQEYNLTNYHESVHLTNHAVQKKYRNARRDKRLPSENMWDCYTFQAYLRQIGEQEMWSERIYPGMRKAIVGAMLASQENMDRRTNTFELFGADFLISEDFYPWLIEINSSPDLGGTTSVTARMCPQCLEDVIKVVIDRRLDPKADTGHFELIYRQVIPPTPAYMGLNLFLKGRQLTPKGHGMRREKTSTGFHYHKHSNQLSHYSSTLSVPSQISSSSCQSSYLGTHTSPVLFDMYDSSPKEILPNETVYKKNSFPNSTTSSSGYLLKPDPNSAGRLLTPLVPSSRRGSDQQSTISPRASISSRRPSKESGWKQNCDIRSRTQFLQNTSRRHLSCGPRIIPNEENVEQVPQDSSVSTEAPLDNRFECIGNKCSLENLIPPETLENLNKSPPKTANPASRKQIFELLYKSKSARLSRVAKATAKSKSSPKSVAGIKRSHLGSVKKSINYENSGINNKILKNGGNPKSSNVSECISSPFHSVGMSLRAWKSRHYKILKDSGRQPQTSTAAACKSAPPMGGAAVGGGNNFSPRRQLCKDLSTKLSGQSNRISTRY